MELTTGPRHAAVLATVALALAACDIGDGTTLQDPTAPTTLPPPDTAPLESVPLDDGFDDGFDDGEPAVLPSQPIEEGGATLPAGSPAPLPSLPADTADGLVLATPWADGEPIDPRHSCDGNNSSPPVSWSLDPSVVGGDAVEMAVTFVDETNLSNGRPFIQWVMTGIDPAAGSLAEDEVPIGAVEAINFFGDIDFAGPCPAPGNEHEYRLTMFALNQQVEAADGTPAAELFDLVADLAIASADVTGTYRR